jgi:hypothetical protein
MHNFGKTPAILLHYKYELVLQHEYKRATHQASKANSPVVGDVEVPERDHPANEMPVSVSLDGAVKLSPSAPTTNVCLQQQQTFARQSQGSATSLAPLRLVTT